jgi:hypothetical protein
VPNDETPERWNEGKPSSYGAVGVGRAHARADELPALIEQVRLAALASGRRAAVGLADELPEDERALVLELVDTLDAVLVEDHEPAAAEIVIDLRGGR